MRTDELTGVQARERKPPGRPLAPGQLERREVEDVRHGTRSFLLSRALGTARGLAPHGGPPRTEAACLAHRQAVVATAPTAPRWHVVVDTLDPHRSASRVRWVAELSGLGDLALGGTRSAGSLASRPTRAACLADPTPRLVFHSTPTPSPWLTQLARWLAFLSRKLLHPGSVASVEDLSARVLAFIDHDKRTARPCQ